MKKTHEAVTGNGSALSRYRLVMIGDRSLGALLYYEFCQLFTFFPGALGMVLRKIFWPKMFGGCGKGTLFGFGVVVRQPKKINLGRAVVISEYCILDGRHSSESGSISVGDQSILSNHVMLSCKDGSISIGSQVGINSQTIVQSTSGNPVSIGDDCVIGQRCLIIGGGNYDISDPQALIRSQPIAPDGGIVISANVWLGANVSVLGGVTIGTGSVAGAGSVISRTIPPQSVCMGVPARVVRQRS